MMPQLEPDPIQLVGELGRLQQRLGCTIERFTRLCILLIVEFNEAVVLNVEIINILFCMTC